MLRFLLVCMLLLPCFSQADAPFSAKLSDAAISITQDKVHYDPTYFAIAYPNGDVPNDKGVCTDVLIRTYRKVGVDLQQKVHQDMQKNFALYPKKWGLKKPDKNIDHRRVPNLQIFFTRFGKKLTVTNDAKDYQTGDIVTWMIAKKLPHIGIVTAEKTANGRPLIVHNVGQGQVLEDALFAYPITGHYRYQP